MRGQCCSKLKVAKAQTSWQSRRWSSLGWYQLVASWKATKAQCWPWQANLLNLPWPRESAEQGVSIVQPMLNEIIGFVKPGVSLLLGHDHVRLLS